MGVMSRSGGDTSCQNWDNTDAPTFCARAWFCSSGQHRTAKKATRTAKKATRGRIVFLCTKTSSGRRTFKFEAKQGAYSRCERSAPVTRGAPKDGGDTAAPQLVLGLSAREKDKVAPSEIASQGIQGLSL